ncbi:site-specific tyrosine recombinase XerD [Candidatus Paracaedibacter symbiosus]|uniref:site-specific tyrosine recombinase XerD n=1 Tax=Candidatus Paracaedibacter symbiosus TaxID=244582 RepID=UPI000509CEA5|nr:site-specific tyrosine recombinase XerD [Candidatus Paracaedibacter symbiosus]
MTLTDIELFLEMLAAEKASAQNTILSYQRDLADFAAFIAPKFLRLSEKADVESYLQSLASRGLAATTQGRRLSAIKQFYKFLLSEQLIEGDPTQLLDSPKPERPLPKTLTMEEVDFLINQAATTATTPQGIRLSCLLEILYASGLRVSELVSLPFAVIPKDLSRLVDQQMLFIKGKGGRERLVPLGQHAVEALQNYLKIRPRFLETVHPANHKWLFPSRSKEGYLTRHRFFQLLKELAIASNIDPEKVSPHVVRHAFATHLLQGGADLLSIQKLLGHADISTTQIYTHVVANHVVNLVTQHHPLAKRKI